MNIVLFSGRLTNPPKYKVLESGSQKVQINIACNMGSGDHKKTIFMTAVAWGKSAENINGYLNKGDEIYITNGYLDTFKYNNKTYYQIVILSWEFGKKSQGNSGQGSKPPAQNNNSVNTGYGSKPPQEKQPDWDAGTESSAERNPFADDNDAPYNQSKPDPFSDQDFNDDDIPF